MFYLLCITMLILISILFMHAQAQESEDCAEFAIDCEKEMPMDTFGMRECTAYFYEKADKELNEIYKKIVEINQQEKLDYDTNRLVYLRAAQRSWMKFRDDWCDYEASAFEGGTMAPVIYVDCLRTITEQQIKRLHSSREW